MKKKEHQKSGTLDKNTINNWIIPFLSVGKRGFKSNFDLASIFLGIMEKIQAVFYTHKKLRSTYRSLKNNLSWLFTCYDNIELNIPNTTNAIDGHFADLKNKLRNHNGLSLDRKKKFIEGFLKV